MPSIILLLTSESILISYAWVDMHPEFEASCRLVGLLLFFTWAQSTATDSDTGLDLAYRALKAGHDHKDLDFWHWLFSWAPQTASDTVEMKLAGQRYVDIILLEFYAMTMEII